MSPYSLKSQTGHLPICVDNIMISLHSIIFYFLFLLSITRLVRCAREVNYPWKRPSEFRDPGPCLAAENSSTAKRWMVRNSISRTRFSSGGDMLGMVASPHLAHRHRPEHRPGAGFRVNNCMSGHTVARRGKAASGTQIYEATPPDAPYMSQDTYRSRFPGLSALFGLFWQHSKAVRRSFPPPRYLNAGPAGYCPAGHSRLSSEPHGGKQGM